MGLINGSLQIGRSALLTHQAAMQIIGNNVANAGDPNYTRQTARLAPAPGAKLPDGSDPGAGVQLIGLQRHIDYALEQRLRSALSEMNYDDMTGQILSRLEALYNEMTDSDLSSAINEFFNAWSELQANPDSTSTRYVVAQVGEALTNQIQMLRGDVIEAYDNIGKTLEEAVDQINFITERVAQLNVDIANASAAGKSPSALLDQRDTLLKELSSFANVHVVEHDVGDVTLYLGGDPLVQYNDARELEIEHGGNGGLVVPTVVFADTGARAAISSGKVGAAVDLIDEFVTGNLQQLDTFTGSLIFELNKVHSSGQGLHGYDQIISGFAVSDTAAALDQAGLAFDPQNGTFLITVLDDSTGQSTVHQINVDLNGIGTDTTVTALAGQINAVGPLNAQVLSNGRLQITADSDHYTFTFSEDSSHVLAALGLNTFFTGSNGADIGVNEQIIADPQLIAASQSNEAGDGSNAENIAQLRFAEVDSLSSVSIPDFYRAIVSDLGTKVAGARQNFNVHSAVVDTLQSQREAISGVNIDEETVNLMSYQRAFQGAARFIGIVNQLMQEVLDLI